MKNKIIYLMQETIKKCVEKSIFSAGDLSRLEVEVPANPDNGDYATNAAMILASTAKQNTRKIAEALLDNISDKDNIIEKTQIAGPGFINFFIKDDIWKKELKNIEE